MSNMIKCVGCARVFWQRADHPAQQITIARHFAATWRAATGGYACSEACAIAVAIDVTPISRYSSGKTLSGVSG